MFQGAGVVVVAGLIGWLFRRLKAGPSEPPPSPNVTVSQGPSDQLVGRYVDELMLTKEAVAALFGALERERPGLTDLDGEFRKLAKEFKDLKASLRDTAGDDREVADLKGQAADALERGEFDVARMLLQEAKTFAHAATVQSGQTHDEKRLAEAEVAAELGRLALTRVRYAEAADHMREAVELVPAGHDATLANYLLRLGEAEYRSGRYDKAIEALKRALEARERALGPDHPDTAEALNDLALCYSEHGRYADAEPLYERAIAIGEKTLGPEHPNLATWLNNLASLYCDTDRDAEAEPLFQRAITIGEQRLGPDHPDLATRLNNLAGLYYGTGRFDEAEPLLKRVVEIFRSAVGEDHPHVATVLNNLAELYRDTRRNAEAEPLYQRAIAIGEKTLGPEHPDLATWLHNLAGLYHGSGRYTEAEPLLKRAIAIWEKALPDNHPNLMQGYRNYAGLLSDLGREEEAAAYEARAQAIERRRAAASGEDKGGGAGQGAERGPAVFPEFQQRGQVPGLAEEADGDVQGPDPAVGAERLPGERR